MPGSVYTLSLVLTNMCAFWKIYPVRFTDSCIDNTDCYHLTESSPWGPLHAFPLFNPHQKSPSGGATALILEGEMEFRGDRAGVTLQSSFTKPQPRGLLPFSVALCWLNAAQPFCLRPSQGSPTQQGQVCQAPLVPPFPAVPQWVLATSNHPLGPVRVCLVSPGPHGAHCGLTALRPWHLPCSGLHGHGLSLLSRPLSPASARGLPPEGDVTAGPPQHPHGPPFCSSLSLPQLCSPNSLCKVALPQATFWMKSQKGNRKFSIYV